MSQLRIRDLGRCLYYMGRAQWLQGPNSSLLTPPSAAKSCHRQKNLHFPWDGSAHTSCSACLGLQPTRPYFCMPVFPNIIRLSYMRANHTHSYIYHKHPQFLNQEDEGLGGFFEGTKNSAIFMKLGWKLPCQIKPQLQLPGGLQMGLTQPQIQQKLTLKKTPAADSEPTAIIQHQLKLNMAFFFNPVSKSCTLLNRTADLCNKLT